MTDKEWLKEWTDQNGYKFIDWRRKDAYDRASLLWLIVTVKNFEELKNFLREDHSYKQKD